MRKITAIRFYLALFIACCVTAPARLSAQDMANKQVILDQARQSYYNLRSEGLASFQCGVTPNWELLLAKERKQDPAAADAAIKVLNQLHFNTSLAPDGTVKVTHNDLSGQNQQMMDALKQIYSGMEQMASGFFDTWKVFMLSPPLPEANSHYSLESVGSQYRLSYKDGTADVVTTMGRDFTVTNLQVTTPEFNSSIQPAFARTPKGLRLSAYEASYQSQKPEEATQLKVSMDYQEVDGLSMLRKLNLSGTYGGSPFAVELAFSGCQVTKSEVAKKQTTAAR